MAKRIWWLTNIWVCKGNNCFYAHEYSKTMPPEDDTCPHCKQPRLKRQVVEWGGHLKDYDPEKHK